MVGEREERVNDRTEYCLTIKNGEGDILEKLEKKKIEEIEYSNNNSSFV